MHIHTCLSLHECSIDGTRCPCFTYLKQKDTPETTYCMLHFFPCGIHAELPVAYSTGKTGNREIQGPLPSTENVHEKTDSQHASYSLLVRNGSKSRQKCPLFCQTFHKITVKAAVCLLPSCFSSVFFQEVLPPMPFLLWSLGSVAQVPSGRTPEQAAPAFCLLVPTPLVAVPIPPLLGFFCLPWPNTITGWRLMSM